MDVETLFSAIDAGDADRVRSLLADTPSLATSLPVHHAVARGRADMIRVLAGAGVPLDQRNAQGRTALHDALESGDDGLASTLVECGATVDLCAAAMLGGLPRLRELLDDDPRQVDDRSTGLTPLEWAAYGDQVEVARELLARGARVECGPLLCAASAGHVAMGRLLLEHGFDAEAIHPEAGANALHAAAAMRYTDDATAFVRLLLDHGVDPTIPDRDGRTARAIAEEAAEREGIRGKSGEVGTEQPLRAIAALLAEAERGWQS